ncbi:guanylate kinase [Thermodesulfitimonas autotrophica]|uniref:Guanylate kinase n=1 Tax=Thermodesulfitimonas autotrophica TaxID=1894989 RepID=A0A3N5AVQ3_9THEO|nr:guanylate kinase [Thermodesulfitimonas autotrophica]RPF49296.1 guanylate kinase [Thermodesulfitimonas autotrophica]
MSAGLLLVLSGPSGVGKGTICRRLIERDPTLYLSISMTTRPPRIGEKEGKDYFFVSEERFLQLIAQDELLEWARVYSYYYGTPLGPVVEARTAGRDVVLEIDVQGGFKVREKVPDSILIFILPPSLEELRARLTQRGTESGAAVEERLRWAQKELSFYRNYDYAIVNERVEDVVGKINAIRTAEKCRPRYLNLDFA